MSYNVEFSWPGLLRAVRAASPELYRTWFEGLPPGNLEGGELLVHVDDTAKLQFLRENCTRVFAQSAMSLTGHLISVRFISPAVSEQAPLASSAPAFLPQDSLSVDYTFDQFVVGPSNRLAHAASRAVCSQPGSLYNPLFIHGSSGLGKTHLLQAIRAELLQRNTSADVRYISCEAFVNDFVRAIETGQLPEFRERARQMDAVVIDDIQFLANRESSQEELFHTFNVLYQSGRQIVLSADSPPTEIPTLEDRLVSRFSWGLVTQIDPPNRETRQAILQKKARLRGCEIPDEVLDFIAARVEANVRLLEGALTKLISETQIGGKPMNLNTARAIIEQFDGRPPRPLQVGAILESISKHFGVRLPDLISRKRSRSISHPRQIGMYLARKLTPLSLEEIGVHFGGRDHSTVLHAERVIEAARLNDRDTAQTLNHLTNQLLAGHQSHSTA
jgi:chromosomal replication initiator protein